MTSVFPPAYMDIVRAFQESPGREVYLTFKSEESAQEFRQRFYKWRRAVAATPEAEGLAPLFRLILRKRGATLWIENADESEEVRVIRRALAPPQAGEEPVELEVPR